MALDDDIRILSAVRLFEGFTQEQLRLLAFGADTVHLSRDRRLYREDDDADTAYVVVRGSITLFREQNGKHAVVGTAGPGTMLGEMALIADTRRLLFYIRLLRDGRLLFGSRGGLDASPAAFAARRAWMERRLGEIFPAWRGVAIEHAWWGLVCLARDLLPHLGWLDEGRTVLGAWAYHGGGTGFGTMFGRAAAARLADMA